MNRFVVIDLEGTSLDTTSAHIVEVAMVTQPLPFFEQTRLLTYYTTLVKPPDPIPPESSSIHHIIDADVEDAPTWGEVKQRVMAELDANTISVAHNVGYERGMLSHLHLRCAWLCTYKAALRVWPDAPTHSNEGLRYWLGFGTGRSERQQPHSALHDAQVTRLILNCLMSEASVLDMIKWTDEPAMLPTCPIGDARGKKWVDVEESFLWWIMRKVNDPDERSEAIRFCAKAELDRRELEREKERDREAFP